MSPSRYPHLYRVCHGSRILRSSQRATYATTSAATSTQSPDHIRIVEVGPRDGLQNEKKSIPVETKIELLKRLASTGLQTIEAGSFVSPKWIPQMANSSQILQFLLSNPPPSQSPINYQFLVPNRKGLEDFLKINSSASELDQSQSESGANSDKSSTTTSKVPLGMESQRAGDLKNNIELSIFTAATETFTMKNTNCTVSESLARFKPVIEQAKSLGIGVRAYISVALGCPYEGPDVDPHRVAELAVALLEMGADEISIGDTTGMGTAKTTGVLLKTLTNAGVENADLAMHFHDTYGQALVNAVVALEYGIRTFDASVSGLGGCPFSPGATGNLATEDLIHCVHSLGATTGVDIEKLAAVGDWISGELERKNESRAGKAILARLRASDR